MSSDMQGDWQERTKLVLGGEALEKLKASRVAVFGAGGVGGAAIEALVRNGIGSLDIIDGDEVTVSNLNRQLIATVNSIGQRKVIAAAERVRVINPECRVVSHDIFVTPENINSFDFSAYDYVIDAIDNITAKLSIYEACGLAEASVISCMGTGNKLDPSRFRISDISKTSVCPLAKVIRAEARKRGIESLTVLWSDEVPLVNARPPGSVSFVPPVAGMMIAGYVIREIVKIIK